MTNGRGSRTDIGKATQAKLGEVPLNGEGMAAVLAIHRAAAAIRQHVENSALRRDDLTWTSFVVLWVVWIGGEVEMRQAAEEAGISKGTLTGVAKTLEARGLVERRAHDTDGRLVVLRLTTTGAGLMDKLFLSVHEEQVFVSEPLATSEAQSLAEMLHRLETHLDANGQRRQQDLRRTQSVPPRRSGRRPKDASPGTSHD
jgi:DNA-binding MarR family transcriptional regulator